MRLSEAPTKIGFKNVLFATDFSPVSQTALPFAESVARRYGSKLIAAHAISPEETRLVPAEAWGAESTASLQQQSRAWPAARCKPPAQDSS